MFVATHIDFLTKVLKPVAAKDRLSSHPEFLQVWDLTFGSFFAANAGTATGVARESQIIWALAIGHLATGALLTLVIGNVARGATIVEGFKIGAMVAFLMWLSVDLTLYGVMNIFNLRATIVLQRPTELSVGHPP